jgi:hypothetical protein
MYQRTIALLLVLALPVSAQGTGKREGPVPKGYLPPAGMCRIWLEGVPAGRQPAPTDCVTAVRNRPSSARVIFGDDHPQVGRGRERAGDRDSRVEERQALRQRLTASASDGDRTLLNDLEKRKFDLRKKAERITKRDGRKQLREKKN